MADHCCHYTNLDEILADPITLLLMESDGVDPADVRSLLEKAREARQAGHDVRRPKLTITP
jgi:hypothetical protein